MVYNTWKDLGNLNEMVKKQNEINYVDESESSTENSDTDSDTSSDSEVNSSKLISFKNKFINNNIEKLPVKNPVVNQEKIIKIKNTDYILDGYNVYIKNSNNTRGELYGVYLNGKVRKKSTHKEIEV